MSRRVDVPSIRARLDAMGGGPDAAVCFDADGTLWSGDVGEDFFTFGVSEGLLRRDAHEPLQQMAIEFGVPLEGDANRQASLLFEGYRRGVVPEREVCAMMALCFAGHPLTELYKHVGSCLDRAKLETRRVRSLEPIFRWARDTDTSVFVVSASPDFVVHVAAKVWNVEAEQIAGCAPDVEDGHVTGSLRTPVPYGAQKVRAGLELMAGRRWLASFGDSDFDRHMLEAAALGVAVRPKPSLRQQLGGLASVYVLDEGPI